MESAELARLDRDFERFVGAARLGIGNALGDARLLLLTRCRRVWYWRSRPRSAERAALTSVSALSGRSSRTTLPSLASAPLASLGRRPTRRATRTMNGKSDQGG